MNAGMFVLRNKNMIKMNACMCGMQFGCTHKKECPFPYYGDDMEMIKRWKSEWIVNINRIKSDCDNQK